MYSSCFILVKCESRSVISCNEEESVEEVDMAADVKKSIDYQYNYDVINGFTMMRYFA